MPNTRKQVLTIAGSDSGGGAGIQADIKAMSANGVFAMSVITAITAQNTEEVTDVFELPPAIVAAQIDAVFDDFDVAAVKTGMLSSAAIVETVAARLKPQNVANLVVDPVMISKSGHSLLKPDVIDALKKQLFPLALVVTPNVHEAQQLSGIEIKSLADALRAAKVIHGFGCKYVLIKGGLTSTVIRHRWRRWTLPLQGPHSFGHERSPEALPEPYRQETMANLNAAVARSLVASLPINIQVHRARVQAYGALLGSHAGVELIGHRPGSACLTQVLRVWPKRSADDAAARIVGALRQAGFEVQGSYLPIHLLGQFSACVWDRLPHTERVWADLIELPCEPTVSIGDVERIAIIIKSCVGS